MGLIGLFYPWGFFLQAIALVHFVRRRPNGYWLWVIVFGGWLGALVYVVVEIVPDVDLLRASFEGLSRRRRMGELEAVIVDNPAVGNLEELADLYLEERRYARARELYDRIIGTRTDGRTNLLDAFYRRALAELAMDDPQAALPDLEHVVSKDPKYDFRRAIGLLAHVHGRAGDPARADALFQEATAISTQSETYYNYAVFLAGHQRPSEAREWAERILAKKPNMPRYLRRRERPWFRKAAALLKQLQG